MVDLEPGPEEPADEDFWELMRRLDGREVHELCAVSAVALNRDGGAGNLMLCEDGWRFDQTISNSYSSYCIYMCV